MRMRTTTRGLCLRRRRTRRSKKTKLWRMKKKGKKTSKKMVNPHQPATTKI
jgi:hypothetical protein